MAAAAGSTGDFDIVIYGGLGNDKLEYDVDDPAPA